MDTHDNKDTDSATDTHEHEAEHEAEHEHEFEAEAQPLNSSSSSSKKKKNKNKNKNNTAPNPNPDLAASTTAAATAAAVSKSGSMTMNNSNINSSMSLMPESKLKDLLSALALVPGNKKPKSTDDHKFWSTQPVPRTDEVIDENGEIEPDKPISEIRAVPYDLSSQFEWSTIDINDDVQIKEVYELLCLNYVEDDDAMFRFDYSAEFLKWALQPPGWKSVWHTGVRVASNKKLVAFISAIPADLNIHSIIKHVVEINFLCVHKKLRSKRLAPVLIKEITRRVHLEGTFQAVYTAGAYLPKPISICQYWHRSLNPKKLIETRFSSLNPKLTMAGTIKMFKLPESPLIPGTRQMEPKDAPAVHKLLSQHLTKFPVAPHFSVEDILHWMIPQEMVIYSYVVEDPSTKEITDFYSFYALPSSVIGNPKHTHINAAYLFYYVAKGMGEDKERTKAIMKDALIAASNSQFDVFNCLDLMDNDVFMEELKFGPGDGNLHYYLYNYRCRDIQPRQLGLMML